ncbi:MAG: DUF554 domain-containing protein [Armatimonadota bacterium]|nr:DUF554 domain-containing protein [Armatimonadota bacterium]MDR7531931.1 DUF554 domain-containing protein [Armatimonadota bacterium]
MNAAAVVVGGGTGLLLGRRVPERVRDIVMQGVGLVTVVIGIQMALQTRNVLGLIVSLAAGAAVGELLQIEDALERLGQSAQRRMGTAAASGTFAQGFVTSSLLFCVGPMTLLGAVQDGLGQSPVLLYTKSVLDGISAVALAAALGAGVVLSAVTVLVYQGGITLLAGTAQRIMTPEVTREVSAVGGVLIFGLGLGILRVCRIRVGNLLPALVVMAVLTGLGPWWNALAAVMVR